MQELLLGLARRSQPLPATSLARLRRRPLLCPAAFEFHGGLPVPASLHFTANAFWLQSFLLAIKS
jgi:hypothetical protein